MKYIVNKYLRFVELPDEVFSYLDDVDNFFYTKEWFSNYEQNIKHENYNLLIYVVSTDTNLDVIRAVVFFKENFSKILCFKYKTLSSLSNYYTTYNNIICNDENDYEKVCEALVDKFSEDGAVKISIEPFLVGDSLINNLLKNFKNRSWSNYSYDKYGNWIHHLYGSDFDTYFSSLSSKVKNTINRKEKKLTKNYNFEYKMIVDTSSIENAFDDYFYIYNNSWKKSEPYPDFIKGLIRTCADNGWLRLAFLYIENVPVAFQFWIVRDGVAYIYKLAYDEEYKSLSPGSIITKKMMKYVIDNDKVDCIDYLTGDDPYKQDWMTERRQVNGLIAYNKRHFIGLVFYLGYKAKQLMKRFYIKKV